MEIRGEADVQGSLAPSLTRSLTFLLSSFPPYLPRFSVSPSLRPPARSSVPPAPSVSVPPSLPLFHLLSHPLPPPTHTKRPILRSLPLPLTCLQEDSKGLHTDKDDRHTYVCLLLLINLVDYLPHLTLTLCWHNWSACVRQCT
jgi:hypothetical protein